MELKTLKRQELEIKVKIYKKYILNLTEITNQLNNHFSSIAKKIEDKLIKL